MNFIMQSDNIVANNNKGKQNIEKRNGRLTLLLKFEMKKPQI